MPTFAFFFWDPTFILLVPALILAFWAQSRVKGEYAKWSRVPSRRGMTGRDVARGLLAEHAAGEVDVLRTNGQLDDHYDPRNRTVNLSPAVHDGTSLASLAIAAHETGHALQHAEAWLPLTLRSAFAPTVGFGSMLAWPLFFIGFLFTSFRLLMDVGILLFAFAVLFHLVTLPVEYDASRRAIVMLGRGGYLQEDEQVAKKVLGAAALTYVAAATMAIMQLVRLLILRNARD